MSLEFMKEEHAPVELAAAGGEIRSLNARGRRVLLLVDEPVPAGLEARLVEPGEPMEPIGVQTNLRVGDQQVLATPGVYEPTVYHVDPPESAKAYHEARKDYSIGCLVAFVFEGAALLALILLGVAWALGIEQLRGAALFAFGAFTLIAAGIGIWIILVGNSAKHRRLRAQVAAETAASGPDVVVELRKHSSAGEESASAG